MRTDWEALRLNGTMVAHKAMIKLVIKSRKYEIYSISAPTPIKGKSPGYCSVRLEGYTYHDHLVEASVHEENKRLFERFCSSRKAQYKGGREHKSNRL